MGFMKSTIPEEDYFDLFSLKKCIEKVRVLPILNNYSFPNKIICAHIKKRSSFL